MTSLVERLRAAGCVFAEEEAELLTAAAGSPGELSVMADRRIAGEPLEVIVGWAEFDGLRVIIEPGVFVPRQRTVALVEQAAAVAPRGGVVIDLCCGSGAIGAALLARRPDLELYAADCEPAAVACARRNLAPDRVFAGDLYAALPDALRGRVAVLAVNAPYVPTADIAFMPHEARDHEPTVALDGGADGMDLHRRVIADATSWLTPGGTLLIETSEQQGPTVAGLMDDHGLAAMITTDEDRYATVVCGTA